MDKNNLGIIKDMAKLFSATILSGLFFTGCVDMDLTPKNQPSEGEVWADATMAEQTVTGLYVVFEWRGCVEEYDSSY